MGDDIDHSKGFATVGGKFAAVFYYRLQDELKANIPDIESHILEEASSCEAADVNAHLGFIWMKKSQKGFMGASLDVDQSQIRAAEIYLRIVANLKSSSANQIIDQSLEYAAQQIPEIKEAEPYYIKELAPYLTTLIEQKVKWQPAVQQTNGL